MLDNCRFLFPLSQPSAERGCSGHGLGFPGRAAPQGCVSVQTQPGTLKRGEACTSAPGSSCLGRSGCGSRFSEILTSTLLVHAPVPTIVRATDTARPGQRWRESSSLSRHSCFLELKLGTEASAWRASVPRKASPFSKRMQSLSEASVSQIPASLLENPKCKLLFFTSWSPIPMQKL